MSELFYRWVLPLSAAGALAVLACLALTPLLNKLRPAARARALAAAFPFFLVPVGAVLSLLFAAKPAPVAAPLAPVGQALDTAARTAQSAAPAALPAAAAAAAPAADPAALVLAALPWIWAVGAVAYTLWQWVRYLRFVRGLARLSASVEGEREALWQEVCAQAGVTRAPRLRACPGLSGPVMTGLVRPVLYLPEGMDLGRLELALRHEAAHLSRGDLWAKALVRLCCRLHWFDPLCALHAARWSRACEYACDEKAAAGLDDSRRKAYGLLLLDAAQSRPLPAGAAGLGGPQKEMKARLIALLHPAAPGRRLTAGVAAALAAALCLSACAAAGLSTSETPMSAPVSSASPQPLTGGEENTSAPESEPETTPLPLPMEEPAEKPELQEGETEVKWEHWTEAIVAQTDYTQDDSLPFDTYVLEREPRNGAEEVSGWIFYDEQGKVVRKEPLSRVELQPAVQGVGRANGEPRSDLTPDSWSKSIGFVWPVPDYTGVSRWKSGQHKGADLMATRGSEVLAMASGTVTMAQFHYSYGNVVVIDHGDGLSTLYAHMMSDLDVAVGDKVEQGQKIGAVGSTGNTTGVQCHVEVRQDGVLLDLHDYFPDA